MDTLFLHYGPGGNAQVEKELLSDLYPNSLFWDQPSSQEVNGSYDSLLSIVEKKVIEIFRQNGEAIKLWGHSFGCDLALDISEKHPDKVKSILLDSPVLNLPQSFYRLSLKLLQKQNLDTSIRNELLVRLSNYEKSPGIGQMWGLVECLVKDKELNQLYWGNAKARDKYVSSMVSKTPFDFEMWSQVLNSFFNKKRLAAKKTFFGKMIVRIGAHDPYLILKEDIDTLVKRFPSGRIEILNSAGHYTHIEGESIFK